jgi:YHS domain-containing protein
MGAGGGADLHVDPVCGKRLLGPCFTADYMQRRYYFCSDTCRREFRQRSEWFRMNELARAGALLTPGKVRWGLS